MDQFFQLPVDFNHKTLHFTTNLIRVGYTFIFKVDVYGNNVLFEPDEEGGYRALVDDQNMIIVKNLLQEISIALSSLQEL